MPARRVMWRMQAPASGACANSVPDATDVRRVVLKQMDLQEKLQAFRRNPADHVRTA